MDSGPKENSASSDSESEIKLKSDMKMSDEGSFIEPAIPKSPADEKGHLCEPKSQCHTNCSTWHAPKVPPKVPQMQGISRIGMYGLGAWRMGNVPSDVIFDKI